MADGNCHWLNFDAGQEVTCNGTEIMTGFCDSAGSSNCGMSHIQAKCCMVNGLEIDNSTCASFAHQEGEETWCENVTSSSSSFLVTTCGSLESNACSNGAASFNVSFYSPFMSKI